MFRSVFAKYVTAFMVIITVGFALLLLIVTSIVGNYWWQTKNDLMDSAAQVMDVYLEDQVKDLAPESFSSYLQESDHIQLNDILDSFSAYKSNFVAMIADAEGRILMTVGGEDMLPESLSDSKLPPAISDTISVGGDFADAVKIELLGKTLPTKAVGIYNRNGELCGIVALSSADVGLGFAVENLTKTIITSALLVLLAALIAAYFITERTVSPLREMRNAARDFANGKFESRVIVRGKDEVAELAEAFNQMAKSLENQESTRNSFVANVSHDLRTPMTTIAGFIDGIRDGVIPPEERDHYLEVVSIEVHRLSRLVASLLDISRIQAGDRKFTINPFDICEMARMILISFEQSIEEKHLNVEFETTADRMSVLADHDAIYQIFYNICHNAVKFSYQGGTLRIRILQTKGKKVQVSVYNEGEGIPKEDLPMVFERFYKSDKSRGLDRSGVGLGLYIAKTIIKAHGERIWVASEPRQNCEFFFTLESA